MLQFHLNDVVVNGKVAQEIFQAHSADKFFDEFRAVLFRKLRPEIGLGEDDHVRVVLQCNVAEIN